MKHADASEFSSEEEHTLAHWRNPDEHPLFTILGDTQHPPTEEQVLAIFAALMATGAACTITSWTYARKLAPTLPALMRAEGPRPSFQSVGVSRPLARPR